MLARHTATTVWHRRRGVGLTAVVAVAAALPFLLAPVRASWLGPEARGAFAFFQSALMAVTSLGALGVRYAAYSVGASGDDPRPRLGGTMAAGTALAVALSVPLAIVGARTLSPLVGFAVAASALLVPGIVLFQAELARAQVDRDSGRAARAIAMPAVVEFALNLVTVLTRTLTLTSSIVMTLATEIYRGLSAARWRAAARKPAGVARATKGHVLRESFKFLPAAVVPVIAANVDVLMYGVMLPIDQVGVYVVAKLGCAVYLPVASLLEGRGVTQASSAGAARALRMVVLQGLALGGVVCAGGWLLLEPLFGSAYAQAVWVLPLACLAGVLRLVYSVLLAGASAAGRVGASMLGSATLLAATVVGSTYVVMTNAGLVCMVGALAVAQAVAVVVLASSAPLGQRRVAR